MFKVHTNDLITKENSDNLKCWRPYIRVLSKLTKETAIYFADYN